MTPEQEKLLFDTHEALRCVLQALKGFNGKAGLFAEFEDHKKQDIEFRKCFYNFRLQIIIVLVTLTSGSGFGIAKLLDMLK